jgi:molybdopterin synthase catalytic subunit
MIDVREMLRRIRRHPDFPQVGMILCHNGVVRSTSRDGRQVTGLTVHVDHERLERILAKQRARPGIVDVQVEIVEDRVLAVGEDVMVLAVAGDIRERVISALTDTLNAIKSEATRKTQRFGKTAPRT